VKPLLRSHKTEEKTASSIEMKEIESVDVLELRDSSSSDLLAELNDKEGILEYWPFAAIIAAIVLSGMFYAKAKAWIYIPICLILGVILFLAYRRDQTRKTVILFYELHDFAEEAFQALHDAFQELFSCARAWHVEASGQITDLNEWKRQAGAGTLVKREVIQFACKTPKYVQTNIAVPSMPVGRQIVYFFPDRVLVYESDKVGAISYKDIEVRFSNKRFIESDYVPPDAQIVDSTWQYVNKKGGPDRRFKNNRQLPIALYSDLHFTSSTGLNELISVSKPNIGQQIFEAVKKLSALQQ